MSRKKSITVYLIHFAQPYHHAQHYLGSTCDLPARLATHEAGHGARLLQVVQEAGIDWEVSRTWENAGRDTEAKFKRARHNRRLCPRCQADLGMEEI